MINRGVRTTISTLWIVVMFNMIFADILGFVMPGVLEQIINGETGFDITQELLLVFAVLLEIPIAMIFLSRVLNRRATQWLNTIAALVTTIFIIGGGSLYLHYIFFASVEVICMVAIVWHVWTWPEEEVTGTEQSVVSQSRPLTAIIHN
ncbi:MAG: DUF6326 family protein [Chloroflexota bacterium]